MTGNEYLDQQEVTITCDGCRRRTVQSYRWLKSNAQFTCTCGDDVDLRTQRLRRLLAGLEEEAARQENAA